MYHDFANKEMDNCYWNIQMQYSISYLYTREFDAPFMVESQQLHNMKSMYYPKHNGNTRRCDGFKLSSL